MHQYFVFVFIFSHFLWIGIVGRVFSQTTNNAISPSPRTLLEKQLEEEEMLEKNISPRDTAEYFLYKKSKATKNFRTTKDTMSIIKVAKKGPGEACTNIDFETGDLTGWEGETGYNYDSGNPMTITGTGLVNGRHTIVTVGDDPILGSALPMVAPGGTFSLRLGNTFSAGNPNDWPNREAERIHQTFRVTNLNTTFIYQYAVVLQNPDTFTHSQSEQPYFQIQVLDTAGNLLPCGYYRVVAWPGNPGFEVTTYDFEPLHYKTWETVGIDLSAYVGQDITIEFTTADCTRRGHFGYAYIDGACDQIYKLFGGGICPGRDSVTLVAPPGFVAYLWSTGDTTSSITLSGSDGDTVSVTLTPVQGSFCNTSVSTVLRQSENPIAQYVADTVCPFDTSHFIDQSFIVNADSIVKWEWDFGDGSVFSSKQNPYHIYDSGGVYNVELIVTNSVGCDSSIIGEVKVWTAPNSTFNVNDACLDSVVTFTDASTDLDGTVVSWHWDLGDPFSVSDTATSKDTSYLYSTTGTFIVQLITSSSNGCIDTINKPVTIFPLPNADAGTDTLVCEKDSVMLIGSGGTIYLWSPGIDLSDSTLFNPFAKPTVNTIYKVLVTDATGCQNIDSVLVSLLPLPVVSSSNDTTVCPGQVVLLSASGGTSYLWLPNVNLSNNSISNPVAFPDTTTEYHVIVTGSNSCKNTDTVHVIIQDLAQANIIGPVTPVCQGDSKYIFGDAKYGNVIWKHDGKGSIYYITSDTIAYICSPLDTGTVKLTMYVVSSLGCGTDSISINLDVKVKMPVSMTISKDSICQNAGDEIQIEASSDALSYQWQKINDSGIFILPVTTDSFSIMANGTATYKVTITDSNHCVNSAQQTIHIFPRPIPEIEASSSFDCFPAHIYFDYKIPTAMNIDSIVWDLGNGIVIKNKNPIDYTYTEAENQQYPFSYKAIVKLYYQNGCNAEDTFEVKICEPFYLPNTFTPDGDGFNDFFKIKGVDGMNCDFKVYNRWGEKIYESGDYRNDWDGHDLKGNLLNTDTYFYLLGCSEKKYTGWVKIIR